MRSSPLHAPSWCLPAVVLLLVAVALAGCGTLGGGLRIASTDPPSVASLGATPSPLTPASAPAPSSSGPPMTVTPLAAYDTPAQAAAAEASVVLAAGESASALACLLPGAADSDLAVSTSDSADDASVILTALQQKKEAEEDEYDIEEYDPWESFNEAMFEFNLKLDRWILKPVAKVYDRIIPDEIQRMIANAFDNLGSIKRLVNSLLQGKWDGAVREWSRFLLNTTMGVGGLFDIAKHEGIEKSREDFGQTLGVYGAGPGPYLVLPFLEPMTVRDGIGRAVDSFLDPLSYLVSLSFVEQIALKVTEIVNERSLNLELFQGFEESVIDFYSAVRHAYLERRRNLIKE